MFTRLFTTLFFFLAFPVSVASAADLDFRAILAESKKALQADKQQHRQRQQQFQTKLNELNQALSNTKNKRVQLERKSDELDKQHSANELKIGKLTDELNREIGDLKEIFGILQQAAGELREDYQQSLLSVQFPDRSDRLEAIAAKLGNTQKLVSIDEIQELWTFLSEHTAAQGDIVSFPAAQTLSERYQTADLPESFTRVGVFSVSAAGSPVVWNRDIGPQLLTSASLPKQLIGQLRQLESAKDGLTSIAIDPTKGQLLQALNSKPTLNEKVSEGRSIGFFIIGLGLISAVVALCKIAWLNLVLVKVKKQAANLGKPLTTNPLGRILGTFRSNIDKDSETMQWRLADAYAKEESKLNSWLAMVKLCAVAAPLLGLLGTVTGMIQTFQAITLYGTGDPVTMAGGISQALVTTVLGLVIAIPLVLLHSSASKRAVDVINVLEEKVLMLVQGQMKREQSGNGSLPLAAQG